MANVVNCNGETELMGNSALYITDDPNADEASEYTKCSSDFHEAGFKTLTNCHGRYLILRRTGPGMSSNISIVHEIRAYSGTNLLEGATVIVSPPPKDPSFSVNNLIQNLDTRSNR